MTAENDAQPDRTEAFMARAMADWGDAVYRLALSQTRSKADAEDVYQDVYQDVFMRNRHTVAFDPVRDDIAELVRDPRDADVWDAVGQLPDNLRSSVHLHYVEGYTTDEIARMLHSQPATVRTWLSRARARVKDLLTRESERTGAHAALPSVVPDPRTHRDQRKEVPHD